MNRRSWRNRISIDPRVCGGQACIRGTRIMVSLLVDCLANGDTGAAILAAYPLGGDDGAHEMASCSPCILSGGARPVNC